MSASAGRVAALLLLALFLLLTLSIARGATPTVDEFADLPAGLAILAAGDFRLDLRNPPLIKTLVALPAWAAGARSPAAGFRRAETGWWPWVNGTRFLRENRSSYLDLFLAGRAVVAVLGALLGWLVFAWARRLHGQAAGLLALTLYVLCPSVLAHSSLATLDIGASLFFFAAASALERHCAQRSVASLVLAGLLAGLALAAKFSAALLGPAFALVLLVSLPGGAWARLRAASLRLAVVAALVLVVLQLAYFLPGPSRPGERKLSHPVLAAADRLWCLWPFPAEFVAGFDDALAYARDPEIPGYLNGRWSREGWWSYHLEAFAIKEPLPLLLLLLAAALARGRAVARLPPALWIPPLLVVLSLTSFNRVQYGLRYALPAYPFLFVAGSRLALFAASRRTRLALVGLVGALAVATLSAHPHQLSYFNSLAGGPANGWRYLADSNLDWGQDLGRLATLLGERYPGRRVRLAYFGHVDPALYGLDYQVLRGRDDASGLIAVSASYLAGEPYAITWRGVMPEPVPAGAHAWLGDVKPVGRAGYSIYVYDLP